MIRNYLIFSHLKESYISSKEIYKIETMKIPNLKNIEYDFMFKLMSA